MDLNASSAMPYTCGGFLAEPFSTNPSRTLGVYSGSTLNGFTDTKMVPIEV
jgi:hypothetical protein